MTLIEIENLPAAELKAQHAELVKAAAAVDVAQLAERYVKARTDATLRDEKLAEQGRTITSLNDSLDATRQTAIDAATRLGECERQLQSAREAHAAEVEKLRVGAIQPLKESLDKANADLSQCRSDLAAANQLATARKAALVDVLKLVADLNAKVAPLLIGE